MLLLGIHRWVFDAPAQSYRSALTHFVPVGGQKVERRVCVDPPVTLLLISRNEAHISERTHCILYWTKHMTTSRHSLCLADINEVD